MRSTRKIKRNNTVLPPGELGDQEEQQDPPTPQAYHSAWEMGNWTGGQVEEFRVPSADSVLSSRSGDPPGKDGHSERQKTFQAQNRLPGSGLNGNGLVSPGVILDFNRYSLGH